jgi:hypothetical protein
MRCTLLVVLAAACGDSGNPSDVSGDYTVALTNRDNGCAIANWTIGAQSSGVPVTITQTGATATATVMGAGGVLLDFLLGNHAFSGSVDGDAVLLTSIGTVAQHTGNCTYTFTATIAGALSGDALSGQVIYAVADNGNSDCATVDTCQSTQDFSGARPPP